MTQIYQNKIVNIWLVLLWDNKYNFYFISKSWENQLQYLIFFQKKRFKFNIYGCSCEFFWFLFFSLISDPPSFKSWVHPWYWVLTRVSGQPWCCTDRQPHMTLPQATITPPSLSNHRPTLLPLPLVPPATWFAQSTIVSGSYSLHPPSQISNFPFQVVFLSLNFKT